MATSWDSTRTKAQLRLAAQRLGQFQYKIDSQGQITRRDIATLLQQGNTALARAKARKLVHEDKHADLLQALEMQVGVILEHMGDFEPNSSPGPLVVEAASSIIYAAPHTESRDLLAIRDLLIHRLGPDFARSAIGNRDNYVAARIIRILSAPLPSASWLDRYLFNIAKSHGVDWRPDLQPHEKVDAISEILDPSASPDVDMGRLRTVCTQGLPEHPPWIRPRVWRLLLGTLPASKGAWSTEARKQRENYYDLVRRLLEPFTKLPPPTTPLHSLDAVLVEASKELSNVPPDLLSRLDAEQDLPSPTPLSASAPDDVRIGFAQILDDRLCSIRDADSTSDGDSIFASPEIRLEGTPEIRLEEVAGSTPPRSPSAKPSPDDDGSDGSYLEFGTPEISLSVPDSPTSTRSGGPTTLLAPKAYSVAGAHPKHATSLLRLLYIHSSLNPANRAPQIASLLVPLYTALAEEVDTADLAHIEADTFWLLETVVGEFADLEDPEMSGAWMKRLGERLSWADIELSEILQSKGLDPALPHYSYRWLTTALTHTLPLSAVLAVWDALFSQPMREKDSNPKLEYLVDICASMLICARDSLASLGRSGGNHNKHLWADENAIMPSSAGAARELDDAFAEGMELLRLYPVDKIGDINTVLQLAADLANRRRTEEVASSQATATTLGARLKNTMWKSFTNQATYSDIYENEEESEESSDEDEPLRRPPAASDGTSEQSRLSISSRLANTVWRGITNQSAMDVPLSPPLPTPPYSPNVPRMSSPLASPPVNAGSHGPSSPPARASKLWDYAEKFKDSDTAATLAKVSTNWKFKALDAWSKRASVAASLTPSARSPPPAPPPKLPLRPESLQVPQRPKFTEEVRRSSSTDFGRPEGYTPPPRPAFFHPVKDNHMPDPRYFTSQTTPGTPERVSPVSDGGSDSDSRMRRSPLSATRSGPPRPLLLSSSPLITPAQSRPPQAQNVTAVDKQWADAVRAKRQTVQHRHSQSSLSSVPPEHKLEPSMDSGSRVVPLNRKSPSPMARQAQRGGSVSSTPSSPPTTHPPLPTTIETYPRPAIAESRRHNGWAQADSIDSSTTLPSPPPPQTPPDVRSGESVRVRPTEVQRGSMVLIEPSLPVGAGTPTTPHHKPSLSRLQIDDTSDSSMTENPPTRAPRVRSKRYPPRLNSLRSKETKAPVAPVVSDQFVPSPHNLAAPEWPTEELDMNITPRAANFDPAISSGRRPRKVSQEKSGDERPRKTSGDGRARKLSSERTRKGSGEATQARHKRESAAVEGDDEGYDELLSAYESEDSPAPLRI